MANGPHKFGTGIKFGTNHRFGETAEIFSVEPPASTDYFVDGAWGGDSPIWGEGVYGEGVYGPATVTFTQEAAFAASFMLGGAFGSGDFGEGFFGIGEEV